MDELNDEERAILAFVKRHLAAKEMMHTLRVLSNEKLPVDDVRAILNFFRELYAREGRH